MDTTNRASIVNCYKTYRPECSAVVTINRHLVSYEYTYQTWPLDVPLVVVGAVVVIVYGSLAAAIVPDIFVPGTSRLVTCRLLFTISVPSTLRPASSMLNCNFCPIFYTSIACLMALNVMLSVDAGVTLNLKLLPLISASIVACAPLSKIDAYCVR